MGIEDFTVEYDGEVHYTGQMITGRVRLSVAKPTEIRGVAFTLSGQAKCEWKKSENCEDEEGKKEWRDVKCNGKEIFFEMTINLAGGGQNYIIPTGDYVYPISVLLPAGLPSTFKGKYGGITYSGKANLQLPWGPNKVVEKCLLVENLIDLNRMNELKRPYENEQSKTFCCCCCASAPLTLTVYIPHTGFVRSEAIPITIDVENGSNVVINHVDIALKQIVNWSAVNDSKEERICIRSRRLGRVDAKASKAWTEEIQLGTERYPNSAHCGVVKIRYELEVELNPSGLHNSLKIGTPITIGNIPFGNSMPDPSIGFCGPQSGMPAPGFGYNPDPGAFTAQPSNAYSIQTNSGTPYPGSPGVPYSHPLATLPPNPNPPVTPYPAVAGAWQPPSAP